MNWKEAAMPQSNQRGIETQLFQCHPVLASSPQSNQRGIETGNRPGRGGGAKSPQSNQRGIETIGSGQIEENSCSASIEPAWD